MNNMPRKIHRKKKKEENEMYNDNLKNKIFPYITAKRIIRGWYTQAST